MIQLDYQKRKNTELFKSLEDSGSLYTSLSQNYIPIYKRFFSLNETNYNNINLNHKWYISGVNEKNDVNPNLFMCRIKNINTNKVKSKEVFFKMAPLLDPYKYLIGKYNISDPNIFNLPKIDSNEYNTNPKILDVNNSAYVDGFFLFLTSNLIYTNNFIHGVDYYGSYLTIKNNFALNIFDDIDYLNNSDFFNKNKDILFTVDNYEHLFQDEKPKLKPLLIDHTMSAKSTISVKSFNNELFEDIFDETTNTNNNTNDNTFDLNDLKDLDLSLELVDITKSDSNTNSKEDKQITLKSNSTCSSRSSHTCEEDEEENCEECGGNVSETKSEYSTSKKGSECEEESESDGSSFEEEKINAIIPKFPVQIIGMEYCENTFDDLILTENLKPEEWYSAFMQIIMILITYQKAFNFTHNDLHTNNVMYNETDKKFIYYCYKKKYYKVPTFGRIFKIIDFGRSIYKFNGNVFCSDSFKNEGDAATQYNTEPYFNEKKPRLEPNYSFDLCRLACSIFDYVVDDIEDIKDLKKCKDPIQRLVVEWCLDDKGINMLYKNNGMDRYPDFKLYKMIARCVHNHTPQAQLERPEFDAFSKFKGEIPADVINIDNVPSYI
jgi:hypothetical protein